MIVVTKKINSKIAPSYVICDEKKFTTKLKLMNSVFIIPQLGEFRENGIPRLFEVVVGGLWGEVDA